MALLDFLKRLRDDDEKVRQERQRVFSEASFDRRNKPTRLDQTLSKVSNYATKEFDTIKSMQDQGVYIPPLDMVGNKVPLIARGAEQLGRGAGKVAASTLGTLAGIDPISRERFTNKAADVVGGFTRGLVESPEESKTIREKLLRGEKLSDQERQYAQDEQVLMIGGITEGLTPKKRLTADDTVVKQLFKEYEGLKPKFDESLSSIAKRTGIKVEIPGLKKLERTLEKANADYSGDIAQVKDIARAQFVPDTPQQAQQLLTELQSNYTVSRVKDRFSNPGPDGYRDFMVNVDIGNGRQAEIQIQLPEMLEAKRGAGHKIYKKYRQLDAASTTRKLTPEETAQLKQFELEMKGIYDQAWAKVNQRIGSADSPESLNMARNSASETSLPLLNTDRMGNRLGGLESNAKQSVPPLSSLIDTGTPSTSKNFSVTPTIIPEESFDRPRVSVENLDDTPLLRTELQEMQAGKQTAQEAEVIPPLAPSRLSQADFSQVNELLRQTKAGLEVAPSKELQPNLLIDTPTGKVEPKSYPAGNEELQFIDTVRQSPQTKPEVAAGIEGSYKPETNKQQLEQAQKFIDENGVDAALKFARDSQDASGMHTAVQLDLMRRFQNEGNYEMAIDVAETAAEQAKTQGQAIQALSVWSKLTPEGALSFAQRTVRKANEGKPKGKQIKLSEPDAKAITDIAKEIQKLPEGSRERQVKTGELLDRIASTVPVSLGQKLATLQTMSHLLNPKTAVRNIGGNTIFAGVENVSDVLAAGMDSIIGLFTGKRSKVLPSLKAQVSGAKKGLQLGIEDALKGIDTTGGTSTQFDLPTRTFRTGVLGAFEKALNIELRATDRAAYTAAFEGSLDNQLRAGKLAEPTKEMVQIAHEDALYRTFQDETLVSKLLQKVKGALNIVGLSDGSFGLGDLVLKYPKTPGNLISRGLDYTPAGAVKSAFELSKVLRGGEFNQKKFVESLSRATAGSGLIGLGYLLGTAGVVTGKPKEDYELESIDRKRGGGGFRLNLSALRRFLASGLQPQAQETDDTVYTYDWAQPLSVVFSMGADMANGTKQSDMINNAIQRIAVGEETLTNQPVIQNALDFTRDIGNYGVAEAVKNSAVNAATSVIPTVSKQAAEYVDNENVVRDTYDESPGREFLKKVQSRVPGVRNQLPAMLDQSGQPLTQYKTDNNFVNVFLNPGFVSQIEDDKVADEVMRLFESTGETQQTPKIVPKKIDVNGEKIQITDEQRRAMQEYVGQVTYEMFENAGNDPKFREIEDTEKTKIMANMMSDVYQAAKIQFLGHRPEKISGKVQSILQRRREEKGLPLIAR